MAVYKRAEPSWEDKYHIKQLVFKYTSYRSHA